MTFQRGNNKACKLTGEQVLSMREKYASGAYTQNELAREFDCSISTVRNILSYVTWRHVANIGEIERPPIHAVIGTPAERARSQVEAAAESKALVMKRLGIVPQSSPRLYDDPPPAEYDADVKLGTLEKMRDELASTQGVRTSLALEQFEETKSVTKQGD